MARRKAEKIHAKSVSKTTTAKPSQSVFDYFRFGESYTSLILGMVVIIILAILLMALFRNRSVFNNNRITDTSSTSTSRESEMQESPENAYTVVAGDSLWSIAEKNYRSGYNWIDIAKANNIENPDALEVGVKLSLPKVEAKASTIAVAETQPNAPNSISGTSYKVQLSDSLWDIAVRAYGDGYKWVQIAEANKITNPDIIYKDAVLQLPR